jgi:hypothetical protein
MDNTQPLDLDAALCSAEHQQLPCALQDLRMFWVLAACWPFGRISQTGSRTGSCSQLAGRNGACLVSRPTAEQ